MTRRNSKQPNDKKPVVANSELWRELTEGSQGKVRGGSLSEAVDGVSGMGISM